MEIYIILNQALYPDSSYYEIVDVFEKESDAHACIQTSILDIIHDKDNIFYNSEIFEDVDNCLYVQDNNGYYDSFTISKWTIK